MAKIEYVKIRVLKENYVNGNRRKFKSGRVDLVYLDGYINYKWKKN